MISTRVATGERWAASTAGSMPGPAFNILDTWATNPKLLALALVSLKAGERTVLRRLFAGEPLRPVERVHMVELRAMGLLAKQSQPELTELGRILAPLCVPEKSKNKHRHADARTWAGRGRKDTRRRGPR